jgi:hypothetical protein
MNLTFIETTIGNAEFSSQNKSESKPGGESARPTVGETDRAGIELTFGGRCAVRRKLPEKRAPKRNLQDAFALCKDVVPSPTAVDSLPAL